MLVFCSSRRTDPGKIDVLQLAWIESKKRTTLLRFGPAWNRNFRTFRPNLDWIRQCDAATRLVNSRSLKSQFILVTCRSKFGTAWRQQQRWRHDRIYAHLRFPTVVKSGGHEIRTRNRLPGTSFPMQLARFDWIFNECELRFLWGSIIWIRTVNRSWATKHAHFNAHLAIHQTVVFWIE